MSAWKPGDVALVADPTGETRPMILIGHDPAQRCWHAAEESGDLRCLDAKQADDARPLVVIDPEDREQVERLVDALADEGAHRGRVPLSDAIDRTQAALRSLLAPPTPDEPMGLGAVVEGADGRKYIRTADTDCVRPWSYANNNTDFEWSQVAAVRVLSEGVRDE